MKSRLFFTVSISLGILALTSLLIIIDTSPALSEEISQKNSRVESKITFTAPEVAVGTVSCKAEWNEFCEDQKTISVPENHKLCQNTIVAKEKTGDSAYEIVSSDAKSITVKFYAKGNRDRLKQQGANIVLSISLLGVRNNANCITGLAENPVVKTIVAPKIELEPKPMIEQKVEPKIVPLLQTQVEPKAENSTTASIAAPKEQKPNACACSQVIDADRVFNCLVKGHGRDNVSCDSMATTIQCVSSKEECRESQRENCPQVMGLNQTTSKKRLFVADSPYCQQP